MKWKLLVTFSVVLLIALWGVHSACAQSTSPHGLKLVSFSVNPSQVSAGGDVTVAFRLRNTTNQPITFSPQYGIFVGARWNSTTDANNRDFGHKDKGTILQPGADVVLKASKRLDTAGTWRFWPAYNVNGQWGPFRWNEHVRQVHATTTANPPPKPPAKGGR